MLGTLLNMENILREGNDAEDGLNVNGNPIDGREMRWRMVLRSCQNETNGIARSIAICSATLYNFDSLFYKRPSSRLWELIDVLVSCCKVNEHSSYLSS